MYSTGNYVWSLAMEHNNARKNNVCMHDWITLLCSRKLTEHCKSAIMEKKMLFKKTPKHSQKLKISYDFCVYP